MLALLSFVDLHNKLISLHGLNEGPPGAVQAEPEEENHGQE